MPGAPDRGNRNPRGDELRSILDAVDEFRKKPREPVATGSEGPRPFSPRDRMINDPAISSITQGDATTARGPNGQPIDVPTQQFDRLRQLDGTDKQPGTVATSAAPDFVLHRRPDGTTFLAPALGKSSTPQLKSVLGRFILTTGE